MYLCKGCGHEFSSLEYNFFKAPQNKNGYDSTCKKCRRVVKREIYFKSTEGKVKKRYDIRIVSKYKLVGEHLNSHHCSTVLKRLSKYEKKLRWQEHTSIKSYKDLIIW